MILYFFKDCPKELIDYYKKVQNIPKENVVKDVVKDVVKQIKSYGNIYLTYGGFCSGGGCDDFCF